MSRRAIVSRSEQAKCRFRPGPGDCPPDVAGLADTSQALAEAVAPVREARRVGLLAAQDRVRRSWSRAAELARRDPANSARERCLVEDRLGEVGPRAVAVGGNV